MQHLPELGETLRARRIELGLSQERLAEMISSDDEMVTQADISRLETGRVKLPRYERLLRLSRALGLLPGDLLARSGWAGASVMSSPEASGILDTIADAIFVVDLDWNCVFINGPGSALLDTSPDIAHGQSIWTLFPSAVGTPFYRQARRALFERDTVHFLDYYPALGKWLSASFYPTADGLTVLLWDVTKDVQSDALEHAVTENGLERLVAVDEAGYIVEAWDAVETLFGYAADEVGGTPLTTLVPERFRDACQRYYEECVIRHDGPFADFMLGIICQRKDGNEFPLEIRLNRLDTPRVMLITCKMPAIADGPVTEELLRVSDERLRVAIEHAGVILATSTRDMRYRWVANLPEGYDTDDIIGKTDADLFPADIASAMTQKKQQVLETGATSRDRFTMLSSDGEHALDVSTAPLRDRHGTVIGIMTAATDITDRVAQGARLAAILAETEGPAGARQHAHHDQEALLTEIDRRVLRPLAAITGYVQMARHDVRQQSSPEIERMLAHLGHIETTAVELSQAITDLLGAFGKPVPDAEIGADASRSGS